MYAEFDFELPDHLDEALDILAEADQQSHHMPLAGGTNLIVDLRARRITPSTLVGLTNIPGLRGIDHANGRVMMGGKTTVSDILRSVELLGSAPSLVESASVFGGQMVRNAATVAGNICYGSPAADLVPPLLALDAVVTLASRAGTRTLPLAKFFCDYRQTARRSDELLTQLSWPTPPPSSTNLFYKLARRKGDAITVVGVAVFLATASGRCRIARIALGAVAPTVKRATAAEQMLEGQALSSELIDAAARQALAESSPIDDVRASADYRRHSVYVITRRLLTQAWERLV